MPFVTRVLCPELPVTAPGMLVFRKDVVEQSRLVMIIVVRVTCSLEDMGLPESTAKGVCM